MKNLLGINITEKENQEMPIDRFSIKSASSSLVDEKNQYLEKINSMKRKQFSSWLLPVIMILIITAVMSFNNLVSKDPKPVNSIVMFIVSIIGAFLLLIYYLIKKNKFINSSEIKDYYQKIEIIDQKINEELNIPSSTIKIDLLATIYKIKDGKTVVRKNGFDAVNYEFVVFSKEDNIYLFDGAKIYEFEKSMFKKIILSNTKARVPFWNKNEKFSEYKIKRDNLGMYLIKYDQIILNDGFNEYEIIIPTYDIEKFNNLLNLKIEEN